MLVASRLKVDFPGQRAEPSPQAGVGRSELEVPGDDGRKLVLGGVCLLEGTRGCRLKLGGLLPGC